MARKIAPDEIRELRLPPAMEDRETQRFTIAWIAALAAIGLLALAGGILVQSTIRLERSQSTALQIVGEQRVRAVTIARLADQVVDASSTIASRAEALMKAQEDAAALAADHDRLLNGDESVGLNPPDRQLNSALAGVDSGIDAVVAGVDRLATLLEEGADLDAVDARAGDLAAVSLDVGRRLDSSRNVLREEIDDRLALAQQLQVSILVAMLVLLVIEALLIFRPATKRLRARAEEGRREREAERRRTQDQLELLARYDHLTGLANRVLFRDRLDHAVAAAERSGKTYALMFLDLDKFKDINDQFGHDAGDQLLVEVAARVTSCARRSDTVARLGGDEFTVILEGLDSADGAANVAQKILDSMDEPFDLAGREVKVTTSIGIALYPDDARDVEDLQRAADSAMYQAKGAGRATYQFSTPELRASNVARLKMINELRRDIASGRLRLVYQPQVRVDTGEVVAVEAFVRWTRPDGTEANAAEFIEVAEDTDLMVPMGEWVVREACRQNREWQREGLPSIRVAVNLSTRQFRQLNLATSIASIVNEVGLEPSLLEIEVTEDTLVEDIETSTVTLRLLKGIGVRIIIDDFGTGYSSINYLRQFPIDALKIDREFLADVGEDTVEENVVPAAIAGLARHLSLETIAEGVETDDQMQFLRRIRCDLAQGWHISEPLEADEVSPFIRRRSVASVDELRRRREGGAQDA